MGLRCNDHAWPVALPTMQELAGRVFPQGALHHAGDLAWYWCLALADDPAAHLTSVWSDGERTVGWAWLQPSGELLLQAEPSPEAAATVVGWAAEAAAGFDGPVSVEVLGTERHLLEALRQYGAAPVAEGGPYFVSLSRSLESLPPAPSLPDGYRLGWVATPGEIEGRAAAHRAAFSSTRVTSALHDAMRSRWPYRPSLDVIVTAPSGEVAAYCQAWYDDTNGTARFEPVGTHPSHTRLGLARAACTAALHTLAAVGAHTVTVLARADPAYPTPLRLYTSLSFTPTSHTRPHTL
ncbi:GNAT family N-acetyltransferase [Actinocorallia aurea]